MTDVFSESTLCVPGLQDMKDILVKSFYCTPDRILGNHVFIDQGPGKQMSITEVGVYEETKRKYFTTGCIKNVDSFKFKLSITYCIILNALISSHCWMRKNTRLLLMGQNNSKRDV